MPPCVDVYVWVRARDRAAVLRRFIDCYVDAARPGDPRFEAFTRTFVTDEPAPEDAEALGDLRRDASATSAFSLYLRSIAHNGAIITLTEEGNLVLGLSLDDPDNSPDALHRATALINSLTEEFDAEGGIAGVELPPPQSTSEWSEDDLVQVRIVRA